MADNDLAKAVTETILFHHLDGEPEGGRLATLAGKVDRGQVHERLVVFHNPRSLEAEYFRYLKSWIEQHFEEKKEPKRGRVLLVSGASLGAGKTVVSLNLALTFARSYGGQVLFLDGDSRKGTSASYLGLGNQKLPGLAEVLTMRARAGAVLLNTGMFDLAYFPGGNFTESYLDHMRGQDLETLIRNLRNRFRYIIIDSPPAFPMPEPAILAQHADGVIIVLRAGADGKEELAQTQASLGKVPVLAVILNGVRKTPGQKYGAYSYYAQENK